MFLLLALAQAQSMPRNPFEQVDQNEPTGAGRGAVLQMIEDACSLSFNVDGITANDFSMKGKDGKPIPHRTPLHGILPEVSIMYCFHSFLCSLVVHVHD